MSVYNPFKIPSLNTQNNTNPFLSVQNNRSSSNFSNNNPFLSKNNQSLSNNSLNPFMNSNSVNNNKFQTQNNNNNNNPFLSSSSNNNNLNFSFSHNNNNTSTSFNSSNGGNPFLSKNNNNNTNNPFLTNSNDNNRNNIFNNNSFNSTNIFSNNNNNQINSSNNNPFIKTLNSNNNNNSPFSFQNSSNNNNINIFSNNGNNSLFNNQNGNSNISFGFKNNNIFGNSGNNISFGFNNNNYNNQNNIFSNNNSLNNNNNLFTNNIITFFGSPISDLSSEDQSNRSTTVSLSDKEKKEENIEKNEKIFPLSKILTLRYQSEDFLEEVLTKLNEDKDNIKLLTKSLNLNNYNDLIIETLLTSKSKKEEISINMEQEEKFNILKQKKMEMKKRREKIINEERYQKYLKDIYKKNEKNELNRILKINKKQNNNNIDKLKNKNGKDNNLKNKDDILDKNSEKKVDNSNKNIIYNILITVYDFEKKKILEKEITIDENNHYILDLDRLYHDIISKLIVLGIDCKFGLDFILNDFKILKKERKINLLGYEIQGYIKPKNDYYKELKMEINIIKENQALNKLNPQLFCKNDKNYILNPTLDIINNSDLFKYNKGLKIALGKISIIFSNQKCYDLTSIDFDEIGYDGDLEIYLDEKNYKKEKSSFKKLWNEDICIIYNNESNMNDSNKIMEYLIKRYFAEFWNLENRKITIVTKIKNLFMTEDERKKLKIKL